MNHAVMYVSRIPLTPSIQGFSFSGVHTVQYDQLVARPHDIRYVSSSRVIPGNNSQDVLRPLGEVGSPSRNFLVWARVVPSDVAEVSQTNADPIHFFCSQFPSSCIPPRVLMCSPPTRTNHDRSFRINAPDKRGGPTALQTRDSPSREVWYLPSAPLPC